MSFSSLRLSRSAFVRLSIIGVAGLRLSFAADPPADPTAKQLVDQVVELDNGTLRAYQGGYTDYMAVAAR